MDKGASTTVAGLGFKKYMSPERFVDLQPDTSLDKKPRDTWSFGIVSLELLLCSVPFDKLGENGINTFLSDVGRLAHGKKKDGSAQGELDKQFESSYLECKGFFESNLQGLLRRCLSPKPQVRTTGYVP